jgi:hypothetical protein
MEARSRDPWTPLSKLIAFAILSFLVVAVAYAFAEADGTKRDLIKFLDFLFPYGLTISFLVILLVWLVIQGFKTLQKSGFSQPTLPSDRFVLRKTLNRFELIKPGEPYKKLPDDREFAIRPDRKLFQTSDGPRLVTWQPDPENLDTYVDAYRPLHPDAKTNFVAGLEDLFVLNPRSNLDFLQDRYGDHFGVNFLTLDLPPQPEKPPSQPRDSRTLGQRAIAQLMEKAHSERDLVQAWSALQSDPTFADLFADNDSRTVLRNEYIQLISDIKAGRIK